MIVGLPAASSSASTLLTARIWFCQSGWLPSTTCTKTSASVTSSSVARTAATTCGGRRLPAGVAREGAVLADLPDLGAEVGDAPADPPAVHLEFRLTGAPRADPAAQPRGGRPPAAPPGRAGGPAGG